MGVVNVTPDSFSDGGQFATTETAIAHALQMAEAGAAIVDIGGESTRPGYVRVDARTQIERVVPVIEGLRRRSDVAISVDTTLGEVARAALTAGADLVNDTTALHEDPSLGGVVAVAGCPIVLMHRFAKPRAVADRTDPVRAIIDGLAVSIDLAARAGVCRSKLILDPGIGFGTRADDVPRILARIDELRVFDCPLLVGTSRKSFLQALTGRGVEEREFGTAATVAALTLRGVEILRVHAVAAMHDVVRVARAIAEGGN